MPKQGEKAVCKECRHLERKGSEDRAECHLHPPTVIVQQTGNLTTPDEIKSAFPFVYAENWCSDWCQNT